MLSAAAHRAIVASAALWLYSTAFAEEAPRPSPDSPVASSDLTFEFRVRGAASSRLVECGEGAGWREGSVAFERDFAVAFHADGMAFGLITEDGRSWTLCGETIVLDDDWHHVAVQRRGRDGRLWIWVDGVLDAAGYGPLGDLADVVDRYGAPTGEPFDGYVDASRRSDEIRYHEPFSPRGERVAREALRGLPGGAVLEAYPNASLGHTILFARFPEPVSGPVRLTIRDGAGRPRAEVAGDVERGAALFVWDGTGSDGEACEPGAYEATLEGELGPLTTTFRVSGI